MKKRLFIKIYGDVIGVGFRYNTKRMAGELGIFGYASNCQDNTLEIEAEGEEAQLEDFLSWCRLGPTTARVAKIEFKWLDNKNEFREFIIKY